MVQGPERLQGQQEEECDQLLQTAKFQAASNLLGSGIGALAHIGTLMLIDVIRCKLFGFLGVDVTAEKGERCGQLGNEKNITNRDPNIKHIPRKQT